VEGREKRMEMLLRAVPRSRKMEVPARWEREVVVRR
jgi:hypothetical protein